MAMEWLLLGLLLAAALLPLLRSPCPIGARRWAGFFFVAATAAGAWLWQAHLENTARGRAPLVEKLPQLGRPGGYVSSDTCRSCHPDQYTSWHQSFHRTMTQVATPASVRGNFEKVVLRLRDETFQLERRSDEYWVEMMDPDWRRARAQQQLSFDEGKITSPPPPAADAPRAWQRVGLLTGSHHMQAYWVPGKNGNQQLGFPFTWLMEDQRWVPRNDVFLLDPAESPPHQVWNGNCISCHATAGQPRPDPQTQIMDTRVAELGIACESCHGPAQEHVRVNSDPRRRYAFHREKKPDPTIVNPARLDAKKSSQVCGQCHAVRFNAKKTEWLAEGFRYQPGGEEDEKIPPLRYNRLAGMTVLPAALRENPEILRGSFWSDGMVRVSGREYSGLIESACHERGELSCLSCHSMHKSKPDDQLAARMDGNQACLQCHQKFEKNLSQHTHHAAGSSGSLCYNCHMPHTTYGLLKAIRSHQISSPDVAVDLRTGRPNACNLCHLDQSLGWTARMLSEWSGKPPVPVGADQKTVAASVSWLLRGDAGQRALVAWHMGWEPARKTSGEDWLAPYLAQLLDDPYSAVRYVARRSLQRLPGYEKFPYDYIGPAEERRRAPQRALDIWPVPKTTPARPSVLLEAGGFLQRDKIAALLKQRNNTPLELME